MLLTLRNKSYVYIFGELKLNCTRNYYECVNGNWTEIKISMSELNII